MGGSAQDAQRKAWNEAMRSAAGQAGTAHASARRSDRRRKNARREKARKSTLSADTSLEQREYRVAVRIDALEGVAEGLAAEDDEEEYDELDEVEGGGGGGTGAKRKRRGSGPAKTGGIPKRFRPRSLASILLEEAGRPDGITKKYLDAEARPGTQGPRYPPRKFCPVTGLVGIYSDPKSGIPYANLKAVEQIRERAPPWMTIGGSAAYSEAVRSLRNED